MLCRCSGVNLAARARPPFSAPSRESATACGFFLRAMAQRICLLGQEVNPVAPGAQEGASTPLELSRPPHPYPLVYPSRDPYHADLLPHVHRHRVRPARSRRRADDGDVLVGEVGRPGTTSPGRAARRRGKRSGSGFWRPIPRRAASPDVSANRPSTAWGERPPATVLTCSCRAVSGRDPRDRCAAH